MTGWLTGWRGHMLWDVGNEEEGLCCGCCRVEMELVVWEVR